MIVLGTSRRPTMASVNAMPLKRTARLALEANGGYRVELLASVEPLLAVAGEDEQRVVDPEREPHPSEHVGGEDRVAGRPAR